MSVIPEHLFDRLRDAEDASLRNSLGLAAHERECTIRYGHINENLAAIRKDFRNVAIAAAGCALTIIAFFVKITFFDA